MARKIQSRTRPDASVKGFLGLLANAIFWLVVAIALPVQAILDAVPKLAPYARWAPAVCYALAFWSFIRAVRALRRLAASRASPPAKAAATSPRPGATRAAKGNSMLVVDRPPTVQRMR